MSAASWTTLPQIQSKRPETDKIERVMAGAFERWRRFVRGMKCWTTTADVDTRRWDLAFSEDSMRDRTDSKAFLLA